MRRSTLLVALLAALASILPLSAQATGGPGADRYIVVLRDAVDSNRVAEIHSARFGLAVEHVYSHAIHGYSAVIPNERVAAVRSDQNVWFVSPDGDVEVSAQQAPTGIRRVGASSNGVNQTLANKGAVGVAVIDTGIDLSHPDLAPVNSGKNCVRWNKSPNDDHGHGTHVAGTIAGRDNGTGVVGVAPAASLYAVKVLNRNGSGTWAQVICGIDWATANATNVKVANMSLGGTGTVTSSNSDCSNGNDDALHTAICKSVKAGVTYAVAAGNSSANASGHVPAGYAEVITVSALSDSDGAAGGFGAPPSCRTGEKDDFFATFSNFGAAVDIAAPGVCILSTWLGGGYNTISGTSMASPHVAGAAALYVAANPAASPAQVQAGLVAGWEPGPIAGDPDSSKEGVVHVP